MTLNYKTEVERSIINRYNNIISDVRAIADVRFGEYWNSTIKQPQRANLFTSFSRTVWYTKESRNMTLTHIDMLIDSCFCLLADMLAEAAMMHDTIRQNASNYIILARDLRIDMMNMQQGILSLKGVYHNDEKIKSGIDDRVARIKNGLQELMQKYAMQK